jgi:hypothetical protein
VDPVVQGADYSLATVLGKEYDKEKTDEYVKMFEDCFSSPQSIYTSVQSQH